jgi:hypothetical protein
LAWWQDSINERAAWWRIGSTVEAGWRGRWVGPNYDFGWEVYDSGSGVLAVRSSNAGSLSFGRTRANTARPHVGMDRAGRILEIPPGTELLSSSDTAVTVPDDGVWYTLTASFRVRAREPGTLSLTAGSTTITGVGTQFTRYRDSTATAGVPTKIRVASSDTVSGNEATYTIDTIVSDTELTVTVAPVASETSVDFRIEGHFFLRSVPADPDAHNNPVVAWALATRTTTRPTTALIAYDVKRSGGVCTFIDRRHANLYRELDGRNRVVALVPSTFKFTNVDPTPGPGDPDAAALQRYESVTVTTAAGADAQMTAMAFAPCAVGSHLSGLAADQPVGMMLATLWDNGTNRSARIWHYTPHAIANGATPSAGNLDDPDNGSAVNPVSAVSGVQDVALLAVPTNSGNTHLLFYVDSSGLLQLKKSTDNGAAWGSATAIWDPTSTDTLSKVSACLTRMGRIVVAAAYSTGNRIRYIYSDDYGTTWDTNTSAGYSSSVMGEAATDLAVVEDDLGNLWTIAAVSSTNDVRIYRGQAEGNPLPDSSEQSAGWKGIENGSITRIDAFPTPDGTVGVICADTADNGTVFYVQLAGRYVVHSQVLVQSANSAPLTTGTTIAVAAGVSASGHVHIAVSNAYVTGGGTSYHLRANYLVFAPVPMERPAMWFGGL